MADTQDLELMADTNNPSAQQDTVRPNLAFPENVWKEMKKAAIDENMSQSELVTKAVIEYLGRK